MKEACDAVIEEAVDKGEKIPPHIEAYLPKHTALNTVETMRDTHEGAWLDGYEYARNGGPPRGGE